MASKHYARRVNVVFITSSSSMASRNRHYYEEVNMTALSALFIGGNGIISAAASRLAVSRGVDLTMLTRGLASWRPPIDGTQTLRGDASVPDSIKSAIGDREWDVVVNFQLFDATQAHEHVELFAGRTRQYVFISTAAAYDKPVRNWPIVESTLLRNPYWPYARGKIEAEAIFSMAYRDDRFPVTIVRPSHTYDPSLIPLPGESTTLARIKNRQPIIVHGDGTSIWTLTHHEDFAVGLVGLLGRPEAIGEAVHITTDLTLTWDQVAEQLGAALGVEPHIVHVASQTLAREIPEWGHPLLGDWSYSEMYDNTKIKRLVPEFQAATPFSQGAREIVDWHLMEPQRLEIDAELDARIDDLVQRFR